jgi:raffinose/stachyose/melibiose transport system substrate-binding protein
MSRTTRRVITATAITALALASTVGGASAQDQTLRVAMGSPGEAAIAVWDGIKAQYEAAHPGWTVEMNYMDDDLYETIGLQNLLSGRNAPDVYFEWTGSRLAQRYADGYAADLTAAATTGPITGLFDDAWLSPATVDGKLVMVPHTADVTNVLFYNKQILADAGLTPPTTWAELLAACDALNAKGIIPIASGNKDLWAAGNFMSHMASRVVGEGVYDTTLAGTGKFDTPAWEQAFGYITDLTAHKCVNESVNAIDDNAGAQLFFQGKAAMHAIGSWLVSWAVSDAPTLDFDFVNWPAMPEGSAGDQGSVIGVETGYVVNAKSDKIDAAVDYLALVNSDANVQAFIGAELNPIAKSASAGQAIDSRSARLAELLSSAPAVVLPPDTGYDLKMANALFSAEAAVLGGQMSPKDALAGIDQQLGR